LPAGPQDDQAAEQVKGFWGIEDIKINPLYACWR